MTSVVGQKFVLSRWPGTDPSNTDEENDIELWWWVKATWGVSVW